MMALLGVAIGLVSFFFGEAGYLTGLESDHVISVIRLGPQGGKFRAVYEAEGCTDVGFIGENFYDGCIDAYGTKSENEQISCGGFLHRITLTPYVNGDAGGQIDILDIQIKLGDRLTGARQPLRFWPQKFCNYCNVCRDMGEGFLEVPMVLDGQVVNSTAEFRAGFSNTNEIVFSLAENRTLVFETGTWSNVSAMNWSEQQQLCNANVSLVEVQSGESHSCRWGRRKSRRLLAEHLVAVEPAAAVVAVEEKEEEEELGKNEKEHIIVASKRLFSTKTRMVPIAFHQKDVFHVGLNKIVDLQVIVDVSPEESRRFLMADNDDDDDDGRGGGGGVGDDHPRKSAEDRQILQRACPTCVSLLRSAFQNITGRLRAQVM
ncbi:hypothetical protein CBR_g37408 [Chara braunii]|uniref:Uncharacterized protein n=1 Tax=Chara braunii TaxID=69332 RepID=A0A388LMT2_CHABU|nr:hypothetical protein CBR_g37408 [Chara braunii]|eukprot:GBG83604.1 hypothetical protein CBR_g37408 [Chara braunii]